MPWAVPTLCVLLVAALALLVLIYRCHSRVSRDRANLRISRDRANVDLQMITHQVQRVQAPADASSSLPDSLPTESTAPAGSLPPGPPSTAASQPQPDSLSGQQVTALADAEVGSLPPEQPSSSAASLVTAKPSDEGKRKMKATKAHVPLSWAEADRRVYASAAGKAYLAAATTSGPSVLRIAAATTSGHSTAPSTSTAPIPSLARPSAASEQAVKPTSCNIAVRTAPSNSLAQEAGSDLVCLADLAELTELADNDAAAALTNHMLVNL